MENETKSTTDSEWMSTREAADYLGVSIKTTRRWAQEIISGRDVRPRGGEQMLTKAQRVGGGYYYLWRPELRGL